MMFAGFGDIVFGIGLWFFMFEAATEMIPLVVLGSMVLSGLGIIGFGAIQLVRRT